ncbi:hypothetical protein [Chamaesiphon sp.]|uniref:hypothetical protein n=1 Tax=Chamaesiphon sp. TaxID=2814140 RepID=UPI003593CAEB
MPERAINPKNATGFLLILIPAALAMSALFVAWPFILGMTVLIAGGNMWQSYEWSKTTRSIDPVFQQLIVQNRGEITPLDLALTAKISGAVSNRYLAARASEFGTSSRRSPDGAPVYYFISHTTLGRIFDDSELETPPPKIMPATTPVVAFVPTPATPEVLLPLEATPSVANLATAMPVSADLSPDSAVRSIPVTVEAIAPPTQIVAPATPVMAESIAPPMLELDHQAAAQLDPANDVTPPTDTPVVTIIQSELAKRLDVHPSTVYKRRSEPNFIDWTRNRDPEGLAWGYLEATKEYYRVDS